MVPLWVRSVLVMVVAHTGAKLAKLSVIAKAPADRPRSKRSCPLSHSLCNFRVIFILRTPLH